MTDVSKVIAKAIQTRNALEAIYEVAENEVIFVKKYGNANELREAREVAKMAWIKYEVMESFVKELSRDFQLETAK